MKLLNPELMLAESKHNQGNSSLSEFLSSNYICLHACIVLPNLFPHLCVHVCVCCGLSDGPICVCPMKPEPLHLYWCGPPPPRQGPRAGRPPGTRSPRLSLSRTQTRRHQSDWSTDRHTHPQTSFPLFLALSSPASSPSLISPSNLSSSLIHLSSLPLPSLPPCPSPFETTSLSPSLAHNGG